ncbi:MAG: transposase [Pseudomonadota bacterium]
MTNYRRLRIKGGTYFFTVDLADRRSRALVDQIDHLRAACREILSAHPVSIDAMVILPDHLHAVWTLPDGDHDYSTRWKKIKTRFTKLVLAEDPTLIRRPSKSKIIKGEKGLWQRRFWEHAIRDERDYIAHVEYCWLNPVKHRLVDRVQDWPYSSFHRDVQLGRVPIGWTSDLVDGDFGEAA